MMSGQTVVKISAANSILTPSVLSYTGTELTHHNRKEHHHLCIFQEKKYMSIWQRDLFTKGCCSQTEIVNTIASIQFKLGHTENV